MKAKRSWLQAILSQCNLHCIYSMPLFGHHVTGTSVLCFVTLKASKDPGAMFLASFIALLCFLLTACSEQQPPNIGRRVNALEGL